MTYVCAILPRRHTNDTGVLLYRNHLYSPIFVSPFRGLQTATLILLLVVIDLLIGAIRIYGRYVCYRYNYLARGIRHDVRETYRARFVRSLLSMENRRAVGLLNPMRDIDGGGNNRGEQETTPVTTACPEA